MWPLLEADIALPEETEIRTSTDPFFVLTADRWLRGRLARLVEAADEPLRRRIDERCRTIVAGALADPVPASRYRRLETLAERLGNHRAAADCRQHLAKPDVGTARQASIRASLIKLSQADRSAEKAGEPAEAEPSDKAWPLGRVRRSRAAAGDRDRPAAGRWHPVPLPLANAGHIHLAADHPESYERFSPMVSRLLHLMIIDVLATSVALRIGSAQLQPRLRNMKQNLLNKRYS